MDARFRVRIDDETELCPATVDDFAALVEAGDITPDDLVFDALTGEWAPARAHPIYRLVIDPLARLDSGAAPAASPPQESRPAADDLDLSLHMVETTPEEEDRAFVARMEAERASDPDAPPLASELPLIDGRRQLADLIEPVASVPEESPRASRTAESASKAAAARAVPRATRSGPGPGRSSPSRRPFWRSWGAVAVLVSVGLALTAAVARTQFRFGESLPVRAGAASADRPLRSGPSSDASVRQAAWTAMVERVDQLRLEAGVLGVPEGWLDGTYLANASEHPEMREFWSDYLRFVETVHAEDADLFRDAYLDILDEEGVAGPVRSLRVAAALADFDADAPRRDDLYARAWELSMASLDLHETLIGIEGRISYQPARGGGVSADPVLEAVGQDAEAQAALEAALDRVLVALHGGGSETRSAWDQVPLWLTRGLAELAPRM